MSDQVLKRESAIADNRDPRGVQWGIFPQIGRALYMVFAVKKSPEGKIIEDRKYQVPEECLGEWTHPNKAQFQIERYLERMWNMSDEEAKKSKAVKVKDAAD